MSESSCYTVTYKEWKKMMKKLIDDLAKLLAMYAIKLKENPKDEFLATRAMDLKESLKYNLEMMKQAELEEPYLHFFIDSEGYPAFKRVGKETHELLYKKRDITYIA